MLDESSRMRRASLAIGRRRTVVAVLTSTVLTSPGNTLRMSPIGQWLVNAVLSVMTTTSPGLRFGFCVFHFPAF